MILLKIKLIELGGIDVLSPIINSTAALDIPRKIYAFLIRICLAGKVPLNEKEIEAMSSVYNQNVDSVVEILEENPISIRYNHLVPLLDSPNETFQKLGLWIAVFADVTSVEKIAEKVKHTIQKHNSSNLNFITNANKKFN